MTEIVFKINGKQHQVDGKFGPDVSLNEYIRNVADLRGTKLMCMEGGCGACVVSVRAPAQPSNELKTFAVNSCLVSVLSCHGWEVTTAEGLGNRTAGYHELQTRLAKFNGTQCGYCTPGWIMNMHSLRVSKNNKLTSEEIENSFASNICRCTGYRPIADAFKSFATDADQKLIDKIIDLEDLGIIKPCGVKCNRNCSHKKGHETNENEWCMIENMDNDMIVIDCGTHKWYKPFKLDDVFNAMANGEYKLVAGNTGQGVYHVINYPPHVIDIANVAELKGHLIDVNLVLGAGMSLSEMMEIFRTMAADNEDFSYLKQLYDHMDLVAHIPVRNIGTIGGNLFLKHVNNEFQSDLFLLFETVGAMVTIVEKENKNTISLTEFLKVNMNNKLLLNVMFPPLSNCCTVKTYKIMPRAQNAHAVVNAGFLFKFHHSSQILEQATIVYGSISPTFIHASKTEAALVGRDLYTDDTLQLALRTLSEEIVAVEAPPEPSGEFRKMLAISLFYKAVLNLCPDDTLDPKYRSGGKAIKRITSQGTQTFDTDKTLWPLNQPIPKLEGLVQCSGESTFSNDLPTMNNEVFCAFVTADVMPGSTIIGFDTTEAFKIPGVTAFYTAKDIPGENTFTPSRVPIMTADEEILCDKEVKFYGQPAGIIVATRFKIAVRAAALVKIEYGSIKNQKPLLTIDDVMNSAEKTTRVVNSQTVEPTERGEDIKHVVQGEFKMGGQYHYTMEPQTCVVKPTEDGMEVYSATQWLDLTNVAVATCLKVPVNSINVIVRRVGGGYGSKISRATQVACAAALVSHLMGVPTRFILSIQDNMKIMGKRYPTDSKFDIGVNAEGEIQYLKNIFYQDFGCSFNEVLTPITVLHFSNCYNTNRWYIEANSVITDTASNTWCRAPSSTEGVAMIEYIMERIAFELRKDPIDVRLQNMTKGDNPIPTMIDQLRKESDYDERLLEIKTFNEQNRWRKRALKLLPLTFGIGYLGMFNSVVSIYHGDGSVVVIHSGIEMGQGINTKTAQVCAYSLGVPLEKVSVKQTTSFTSPNSMVTGGSVGSECVAFATMKACNTLVERLKPIRDKYGNLPWEDLINNAYAAGIDLQATNAFTTNDAQPYPVYAVCALEVEVDVLTGNHDVKRVDLLEDTGRSLNPDIDVGQIEGAFVMALGYWTSEKLVYDPETGKLLTDRTWTYKPPGIKDIPADMRIYFRRDGRNEFGVLQSKATGEPASCLATVVIHALREAVLAARLDAGYPDQWLDIENPCTVENIFTAVGHKIEHFKLK